VFGYFWLNKVSKMRFETFVRPLFVRPHQPRVACHIGGKDRGETAFDGLLHGLPSGTAIIAEPQPRVPKGFAQANGGAATIPNGWGPVLPALCS
jgi:hypothetical protein